MLIIIFHMWFVGTLLAAIMLLAFDDGREPKVEMHGVVVSCLILLSWITLASLFYLGFTELKNNKNERD